jgi:hypothetical protein
MHLLRAAISLWMDAQREASVRLASTGMNPETKERFNL